MITLREVINNSMSELIGIKWDSPRFCPQSNTPLGSVHSPIVLNIFNDILHDGTKWNGFNLLVTLSFVRYLQLRGTGHGPSAVLAEVYKLCKKEWDPHVSNDYLINIHAEILGIQTIIILAISNFRAFYVKRKLCSEKCLAHLDIVRGDKGEKKEKTTKK